MIEPFKCLGFEPVCFCCPIMDVCMEDVIYGGTACSHDYISEEAFYAAMDEEWACHAETEPAKRFKEVKHRAVRRECNERYG